MPTAIDDGSIDRADEVVTVISIFGGATKQPLVQITFRGEQITIPAEEAREVAINIFDAACAAEFDAVVYHVATQKMGLSIRETANLLQAMRESRDALWAQREAK
jgi:hypothetical protein